jgi:hypothetical protein
VPHAGGSLCRPDHDREPLGGMAGAAVGAVAGALEQRVVQTDQLRFDD